MQEFINIIILWLYVSAAIAAFTGIVLAIYFMFKPKPVNKWRECSKGYGICGCEKECEITTKQ